MAKTQAIFDTLPATMRSSMAKDLAAGRQLELDGIVGPILRGGTQHRVAVPITEKLAATIQELAAAHPA